MAVTISSHFSPLSGPIQSDGVPSGWPWDQHREQEAGWAPHWPREAAEFRAFVQTTESSHTFLISSLILSLHWKR